MTRIARWFRRRPAAALAGSVSATPIFAQLVAALGDPYLGL